MGGGDGGGQGVGTGIKTQMRANGCECALEKIHTRKIEREAGKHGWGGGGTGRNRGGVFDTTHARNRKISANKLGTAVLTTRRIDTTDRLRRPIEERGQAAAPLPSPPQPTGRWAVGDIDKFNPPTLLDHAELKGAALTCAAPPASCTRPRAPRTRRDLGWFGENGGNETRLG